MNIQTDPTQVSSLFERATRADGSTYIVLTTTPETEWLRDAVYAAHDGELPNDWRFQICAHIVELLEDGYSADMHSELADSLVDVYTANLFAWLAADQSRTAYCDEAWSDDLASASDHGIVGLISAGQYLAISAMVDILAQAIEENRDQS